MSRIVTSRIAPAVLGFALLAAGCGDNTTTVVSGPDFNRTYIQIERLGNPLTSEVFLEKRTHGAHNASGPADDVTRFKGELEGFVRNVGGRSTGVATTLSSVLLPDELIVDTNKPTNANVSWLSWALVTGGAWGGRPLQDDVVDDGLQAIFGSLLDNNNTTPGLTSDNVGPGVRTFSSTFPYLANPH